MKLRVNFFLSKTVKVASKKVNSFKVLPDTCSSYRCDSATSDRVPASLRTLHDIACSSMSTGELQQHCAYISIEVSDA